MATTSFINAQLIGDRVALLYRDDAGVLKQKTVPAEYVTFHPIDPDPIEATKEERTWGKIRDVVAVSQEKGFFRVRWKGKWERRDACKKLRDINVTVFEGDVSPIKRLVSDLALGICKPRRLFFDIETDSRVNFHKSRSGEARVISWAAIDENGFEFTAVLTEWTDQAEQTLLQAFWQLAETGLPADMVEVTKDEGKEIWKARGVTKRQGPIPHPMPYGYDQLIAWSGRHGDETYDFVVMDKRSQRMGAMPKDIARFLWLDHHDVYERMNKNAAESGAEKQSLKLQDVSMGLLGRGKDDFDSSKTYEAWAESVESNERLRRYNLKDVRLMIDIERKTGYIEVFQALCEVCSIFPTTYSLYPTVQMDGFMLHLGSEHGFHFKTRYWDKEEDDFEREQFEGAFVLHPKKEGIVRDVHVGDFASMYPSIIISWNMSPETKLGIFMPDEQPPDSARCPGTGVCFSTKTQGILAFAINEMLRLRAFWRKKHSELPPGTPEAIDANRRSNAYKVAANSFFGAMGNRYARYYDEEIAESITTCGSWLSKQTIALGEESYRQTSIYGDTDAVFVTGVTREEFVQFVDDCNKDFFPRIVSEVGVIDNRIKFENEKGYKRLVFMKKSTGKDLASKRYVGIYSYYKGAIADSSSKPEIKGLAWKRGDTNLMGRQLQEEIIDLFADDEMYLEHGAYLTVIEKWKDKVLNQPLSVAEVKMTAQLTKEISEYAVKLKKDGAEASQPAHVRVAKVLRERGLDTSIGTRIEYFMFHHPSRTVLPADDYKGECDRFHLWEEKVYKPSLTLLEAIFPGQEWKEIRKARPKPEKKVRGKKNAESNGSLGGGDRGGSDRVEEVHGEEGASGEAVPSRRTEEALRDGDGSRARDGGGEEEVGGETRNGVREGERLDREKVARRVRRKVSDAGRGGPTEDQDRPSGDRVGAASPQEDPPIGSKVRSRVHVGSDETRGGSAPVQSNGSSTGEKPRTEPRKNRRTIEEKFIYHADAEVFLNSLAPESVDLFLIDPPYYGIVKDSWDNQWKTVEDYLVWLQGLLEQARDCIKLNGSILIFQPISNPGEPTNVIDSLRPIAKVAGWHFRNWITWKKRRAYGKEFDYLFCREEILWFSASPERTEVIFNIPLLAKKRGYDGWDPLHPAKSEFLRASNVWDDIPELMRPERNCQKPEPLINRLIETHSNPGDLVSDFFSGYGTSAICARKLGRRFLGCEAIEVDALAGDGRARDAHPPKEPSNASRQIDLPWQKSSVNSQGEEEFVPPPRRKKKVLQ